MEAEAIDAETHFSTLDALVDALDEQGQGMLVQAWTREGPQEWPYRAIATYVRNLAHGLRERIEPGEPVALLAANRPEWIIAALAILRAGGVVMPLDVQLDQETLGHVLGDSQARWVFADAPRARRVREVREGIAVALLDNDAGAHGWRTLTAGGTGALPRAEPEASAALFYTSGTTGPPKGVPLSHANIAAQLNAVRKARVVGGGDRVLLPLPLHHAYPFVIGLLVPISLGLTVIFPQALTGPQVVRAVRDGRASVIIGVPRLYAALSGAIAARAAGSGRIAGAAFRGGLTISRFARERLRLRLGKWLLFPLHREMGTQLRVLASGGSTLDAELAWTLEALGWQVGTGYGLTETSPLLSLDPPDRPRIGSVGRPMTGVELRLDPEPVPDERARAGEGEILARGPNVFSGYRGLPEKTRAAFTADGWYRTGDLGYRDTAGYLYVTGRASTLIVTEGGENVQPDVLEERYARHPAIRELGVLQREGALVGLAVPSREAAGEDAEARVREAADEVGRELPSYERLAHVAVTRKPLPCTRLGKLRRHVLEERYDRAREGAEKIQSEPLAPEEMSADDRSLFEERAARRAWEYLAQRYPKRGLSPDTSLRLDLHVDSMEWLNLTMELGRRAGMELDEAAIARVESVRDLLRELIDAADSGADGPAAALEEPEAALNVRQRRWIKPAGATLRLMSRVLHGLNRGVMRGVFCVRADGLEHLPAEGPIMLACSHASYLDPFAVATALPRWRLRTTYWVGWTGVVFTGPLTRLFSRLAHVVPIDPEHGARSGLAFSAAILKRRNSLILFPEGRRSPDGRLQAFRPGIGVLLERYPVPVVLVSIHGSYQAMPPDRRLPRPHPIGLRFGKPLDPRELAGKGAGETDAERIVDALQTHMRLLHGQDG
ncbi:MAG: AMP-binding protein [Nitrococcus sp.]|nr:AMP-binding protein [Nitrococcus sp.]